MSKIHTHNSITNQSVKRPGSPIASGSGSGAKKRSQNPVEIPEDVWLEALKHLSCPKWSRMRLVTHQLNGLVGRNVSRLPLAIIDSAEMKLMKTEDKLIVSDSSISQDEQAQWFKDRGMTLAMPGDIQLNKAIIGMDLKENCWVDLCVPESAQGEELGRNVWSHGTFGQQFSSEVHFFAEFSPHRNKCSWASMAFFLKLLYDPSTYVKKLTMYGLSKKLKEILFADEKERYIRCKKFILGITRGACGKNICESVSWLEQNVQADIVQFPDAFGIFGTMIYDAFPFTEEVQLLMSIQYDDSKICNAVTNYLLGSSWTSASQVVKLGKINDPERFFGILIEKFPTVAVQSIFPTIVFRGYHPLRCDSLNQLSRKWIVKENQEDPENDSDDSQYIETYAISNGSNRMRIELIRLLQL